MKATSSTTLAESLEVVLGAQFEAKEQGLKIAVQRLQLAE